MCFTKGTRRQVAELESALGRVGSEVSVARADATDAKGQIEAAVSEAARERQRAEVAEQQLQEVRGYFLLVEVIPVARAPQRRVPFSFAC